MVCLKTLAFIIQQSNEQNKLVRTEYKNVEYKTINLEKLEWIVEDIVVKFSILPFYFLTGVHKFFTHENLSASTRLFI